MKIVIKPYDAFPCSLRVFKINDINADINDFGEMRDTKSKEAEPYCCKCMQFIKHNLYMQDAIEKYNISESEFIMIQTELEQKMYVGSCGWCV